MDEHLKQTIANELNVRPAELTSDKRLSDFDVWDSVMVLIVMMHVSQAVEKEILPEEMASIRTFGDLESLVASKRS